MMFMLQVLTAYGMAFVAFLLLNTVWLSIAAQDLYRRSLAPLVSLQSSILPGLVLAGIFSAVLTYFVILPARSSKQFQSGLTRAALLGLLGYATLDLTNLSMFRDWPLGLVVIDIIWGAVLATTVTALTLIGLQRLFAQRIPSQSRRSGKSR